jgi:hypothetical protein
VAAVAELESPGLRARIERLLSGQGEPSGAVQRVLARVRRVLRLDASVYGEIETDPAGIPQAFAVVLASALIAGVGQLSPVLIFLGVVWALLAWLVAAALVWGVATLALGREVEYSRLVVGLGYGYAFAALLFFARLPLVGTLVGLASLGLCFAAFVQASERAFAVPRDRALAICGGALVLPFGLLLVALL